MNMDRIMNMVINSVMRQFVHRGINAGINRMFDGKPKSRDDSDPKTEAQSRETAQKMQRVTRMFRRF